MKIIHLPSGERRDALPRGCAAALGSFDGVHLGHRAIFSATLDTARRLGTPSAVWMIESSNGSFKGGELIMSEEEKLRTIAECGIEYAVTVPFDEIRTLSGESFVRDVLLERLSLGACVCGFNFRFGHGASCSTEELARYCADARIELCTVPALCAEGEIVSSSRIRALIAEGRVDTAAELLSRPFYYRLPVLPGKHLGRELGIPTANQLPPSELVCPPHGVYATALEFTDDGGEVHSFGGCTNLGVCPTIDEAALRRCGVLSGTEGAARAGHAVLETYIDGFSGELYGREVKLAFLCRLRGELRFNGTAALVERVGRDIENARRLYAEYTEKMR